MHLFEINPNNKQPIFSLSADVTLADLFGVKFELMVNTKSEGSKEWKMGLYVPKVDLCSMMKTFFKADILDGCWLKDIDYSMFLIFDVRMKHDLLIVNYILFQLSTD